MTNQNFKAEKISRTESFYLNSNIEEVFPLFGAFEERKWEPRWKPILIYPSTETIEEGTTFKTEGFGDETEFLWRVSKYDEKLFLIQYLVSTENRYWTITVQCSICDKHDDRTLANVTYTFIGLNSKGNELNKTHIESLYKNNLSDWAEAINSYLKNK